MIDVSKSDAYKKLIGKEWNYPVGCIVITDEYTSIYDKIRKIIRDAD